MPRSTNRNAQSFSLTYRDRSDIRDDAEGLTEPSGLALSHGKKALWTISDDTKRIFKLSLDGKLKKSKSFAIQDSGLEGITLDPTGKFLLTVKEETNEILKIEIDSHAVDRHPIAEMAGYDVIAHYFANDPENKGLEGITCNEKTAAVFVMKESHPGLLIEISSDLHTIQNHRVMTSEHGFRDARVDPDELDFSDLCCERTRDALWIIGDKAARLFLYDCKKDRVTHTAKLTYKRKGKKRRVKKAEGLAVDPDTNRLYVVSDEEARLYVFDINW